MTASLGQSGRQPVNAYPAVSGKERDRWILSHRSSRNDLDPLRPYAFWSEEERDEFGRITTVATILLTNRECPWRCLHCDLWKNTLTERVPGGAIPAQIGYALQRLPTCRQIKLYNSGSFFDSLAIPPEDDPAIARLLEGFERVIVECHPALVGARALRFGELLLGRLEVAMGLETVHPEILPLLNKRMTLDQFERAAVLMREHQMALRVFLLLQLPWLNRSDSLHWAKRSIDFAQQCDATAVSLIPTRTGNGAMDVLARNGQFVPPTISILEEAVAYGIERGRGRVFADLWDLEQFSECSFCYAGRRSRLETMNQGQTVPSPVHCVQCSSPSSYDGAAL